MTKEQELYTEIGLNLKDSVESQMFGKPCFKINGKAFMCFFENAVVFKLTGETHREALSLDGTELFDPSGKRPMKEWILVPYEYHTRWELFAQEAINYVGGK